MFSHNGISAFIIFYISCVSAVCICTRLRHTLHLKLKVTLNINFPFFHLDAKGTEAENARLFPNNVVVKSWH